jgi:hypothetical protein
MRLRGLGPAGFARSVEEEAHVEAVLLMKNGEPSPATQDYGVGVVLVVKPGVGFMVWCLRPPKLQPRWPWYFSIELNIETLMHTF